MKKVKDGWHVLLGYRVWVEKNKVKYANDGKCGYAHIYRRVDGKWVQTEEATVSAFYTGMKLGYITVLMDGRDTPMKKFRFVDEAGSHCPMLWIVTCEGNEKVSAWYETREEAVSAVMDATGKNKRVTIEGVCGGAK